MLCDENTYNKLVLNMKKVKKEDLISYLDILFLIKNTESQILEVFSIYKEKSYADALFGYRYGEECINYYIKTSDGLYKLEYDGIYNGFCKCTSDMEGYNPIYQCCGNGNCDYAEPYLKKINSFKEKRVKNFLPKDLWNFYEGIDGNKINKEIQINEAISNINNCDEMKKKYLKRYKQLTGKDYKG